MEKSISLRTITAAGLFIPAWKETLEAADLVCVAGTAPTTTEGPYWVDPKLFRSDIRTEPSTGVKRTGVPLNLTIKNSESQRKRLHSAGRRFCRHLAVRREGHLFRRGAIYNPGGGTGTVNTSTQTFLRGYQITDENGQVKFLSIYPGWYTGRTIHIHIRVRTYNGTAVLSNFVSQISFEDTLSNAILANSRYSRTSARDTSNTNDMIYSVTNRDRMMATASGSASAGVTGSITMGASFQVPAASTPSISSGGVAAR